MTEPDDAFIDGCGDLLGGADPLPDENGDLFVLFAEALDPASPKTVAEVESEWSELFR
jgi:hypothetical protein